MNGLDLAYILAAGFTAPVWLRKRRSGWDQRLGRVEGMLAARNGRPVARPRLLLHAVSVGEVNALRTLVPLLAREAGVVVSTTTDTGLRRAQELYEGVADVVRYPLDFSSAVSRFLDLVRPDAVGLVELELWPNFIAQCRRRGIPVCVINGRLSERSFRGYHRFRRSIGWMFRSLEFAAVQDADYAARFEAMGVDSNACLLTGSMKWDSVDVRGDAPAPSEASERLARELGIDRSRPLIVAGSTGPGEEELLHASCPEGVQLACAPRKPERFDEAAAAMPGCVRRSAGAAGPGVTRAEGRPRFLLDTIGELGLLYQLADLAVVGRSFGELFGSDPIEPAALGVPTLIGPRHSDFASIVGELERFGGIVVCPRERLAEELAALLGDAARRGRIGRRGREGVRACQGASARHAELLLCLGERAMTAGAPRADAP